MNMSSVQEFSSQVPKDETLKELDVLRFRPNIIGKRTRPLIDKLCPPNMGLPPK